MKILVTGGNGFVGAAIIEELLKNNFGVYSLIRSDSAAFSRIRSGVQVLKADIRDLESLQRLEIHDVPETLIHTAGLAHQFGARSESDFWETNVRGTENTVEWAAAQSIKHFILISSVAVYGKSKNGASGAAGEGFEESIECRPEGIYAQSKLESENIARKICDVHNIRLTILRLATVVGENDRGNVRRLIEAIDRRRFVWIGKGTNLKSLIYKGDVAAACLKVLENGSVAGTFNVTADALPMSEIVAEIYLRLQRKNSRLAIPKGFLDALFRLNAATLRVAKIAALSETVRKWLSDDVFSSEKFRRTYNFQLPTPIREAVGREVESYLERK